MESTALKEPTAAGLNVTVISQDAAAATLDPQSVDCENAPVMLLPATARGAAPTLVSVTCFTVEVNFLLVPKFKLAGASCTVPVETVIAAVPDFVVSVAAVAVRVTGLAGAVEGAE